MFLNGLARAAAPFQKRLCLHLDVQSSSAKVVTNLPSIGHSERAFLNQIRHISGNDNGNRRSPSPPASTKSPPEEKSFSTAVKDDFKVFSSQEPYFGRFEQDFAADVDPADEYKPIDNKVVIFDKDGTLICFHSMWTPWALDTAAKIETASGMAGVDIANAVYDVLGFCPKEKKVRPGLLAEATMPEIKGKIAELLVIHGMEVHEADEIVNAVWENCDTSSGETLKTLHNLKNLFESLRQNGFKIAVCTADSREGTEGALEKLGLLPLIDVVVCGDDAGTKPKPNPDNALAICKALASWRGMSQKVTTRNIDGEKWLMVGCGGAVISCARLNGTGLVLSIHKGVDPENAYMVGDTIADVGMGHAAKLGGSIGVLSGVASAQDLKPLATHLIPDVGSVLPIVTEKEKKAKARTAYAARPSARKSAAATRKFREYLEKYGGSQTQEKDLVKKIVSDFRGSRWEKTKPVAGLGGAPEPPNFPIGGKRKLHTLARRPTISKNRAMQVRGVFGPPPDGVHATHIIVGAGSAGCVLANRLTEDPDNRVLLLEAGPKDAWWNWKIHMPAALMYNLCNDAYNWYYHTDKEDSMDGRVMYWPRGRVLGGSSSLNAMVYIRGHAEDYNRWEREGATGWSYKTCLPYFRKAQTHELGADEYRGGSGPLHVTQGKCENPLYQAFIEAGEQAGFGYTPDMNGYRQEGVGPMDMTIHKGKRWNTSQAYLMPVIDRPNLFVVTDVLVHQILFAEKKAVGVRYAKNVDVSEPVGNNFFYNAYAESDVVLCGGAINSPQLLLGSGVGPPKDLYKWQRSIKLIHSLPGVGQNLQDHLEVYVQHACTQPISLYDRSSWKFPMNMIKTGLEWFTSQTGDGASNHLEAGGFVRSNLEGVTHPDIQFHFLPSAVYDHGRVTGDQHAYQVHVGPMRPLSRGSLKLSRVDPREHPLIQANYLTEERDVEEFRECIRVSREIFAQKAFDPFRGKELAPGPDIVHEADIDAFIRKKADSAYHPSCTCKMGTSDDPMAVVDPLTMKVHGLEGLRVVDASVMPSIVSGNLNGPTIMIAERAADLIQGKEPLPPTDVPVWTHSAATS